jgi:hypothetical protein
MMRMPTDKKAITSQKIVEGSRVGCFEVGARDAGGTPATAEII